MNREHSNYISTLYIYIKRIHIRKEAEALERKKGSIDKKSFARRRTG
jgi:hypothetical protein